MSGRNVVVVGAGFVGLTTAGVLAKRGHRVVVVEKDPVKLDVLSKGGVPFHEPGLPGLLKPKGPGRIEYVVAGSAEAVIALAQADATIICVGTPHQDSGAADTSAVMDAAAAWRDVQRTVGKPMREWGFLFIRSTVLPEVIFRVWAMMYEGMDVQDSGTVWPRLAMVPEFLAEGTAVEDSLYPMRVVFGWAIKEQLQEGDQELAEELFVPETGSSPVLHTNSATASMLKYASNAMLASRLSMLQELAVIAEATGADMQEISAQLGYDERIGNQYLQAGAGWGGSCFPKDVRALLDLTTRMGTPNDVLRGTVQSNGRILNQWLRDRVLCHVEKLVRDGETKVEILWLGVAFKGGTSDTRDSPSLVSLRSTIDALAMSPWPAARGVEIRVHDPAADIGTVVEELTEVTSAYPGSPVTVSAVTAPERFVKPWAAQVAHIVVVATGWEDYALHTETLAGLLRPGGLLVDARGVVRTGRPLGRLVGFVHSFGCQVIEP